jgi:tetratricopeptide (TPR) repeat protein
MTPSLGRPFRRQACFPDKEWFFLMRVTTAPKKRLTKHDLKEDRFVTTALEAWDYAVLHKTTILLGLLGVVILVGAVILYQQSARGRATRANEILLLAMGDFDAGNFEAASNGLSQFLDRAPRHPKRFVASLALGNSLLALGRPADAQKPFEEVARSAPKGSEAWTAATFGLGLIAEAAGTPETAVTHFEAAAQGTTSKEAAAEATAHAIHAKILLKDLSGAQAPLDKAAKDYAMTRAAARFSELRGQLVIAQGR